METAPPRLWATAADWPSFVENSGLRADSFLARLSDGEFRQGMAALQRGAVTVVEFFDYGCPYCRMMEPRLHELLTQDKSVRLVLKDWPIFGGVSVYAVQVAIAAGWQGKYAPVHDALFTLPRTMDRDAVRNAARKAGVDLAQLDRDLSTRGAEIDQILGKTDVEARMLQLQGTPGFVIGDSLVPGALSLDDLEHLVANAKDKK